MMNILALSALVLFSLFLGGFLVKQFLFSSRDKMRAMNLIFFQVLIPKKDGKEDKEADGEQFGTAKDFVKLSGVMSQLFASMHAIRPIGLEASVFRSDYFTCEYSVIDGEILFHIGAPRSARELIEKQITSYYPDAVIEETPAPNVFTEGNATDCCLMNLGDSWVLPIKTMERLDFDSLNNIANALSKIRQGEGAAIQLVCRPLPNTWQTKSKKIASGIYNSKKEDSFLSKVNPLSLLGSLFNMLFYGPSDKSPMDSQKNDQITPVEQEKVKAIEEKSLKSGFDVIIRLVSSAPDQRKASMQLGNIKAAFEQFGDPSMNGFASTKHHSHKKLIAHYIYRRFDRGFWYPLLRYLKFRETQQILGAEEMACLYHFPNAQYNKIQGIKWQEFKIAAAPHNLPKEGLLLGLNNYRGESREVRIKRDDRRRHFYAIGKSGTGKSTILEYMIRQDLQNGEGVCVIDPHGDLIENVLPYVPRERADDVVLFDPGDLERPMGLNLLEAKTEEQKEFIAQEALGIFIKLFGEEIMGPRLQHYFRNGTLTLMSDDEEGATLLDLPRLFTDPNYEKMKVKKVKNPIVRSFWEKEMAKTGQREREEMIPYFSSKFGPFVTNAQIRNILGQTKSGFDFRDVMDNQKILLVNLSKGKLGDLNSKLLGMIMVSKIQMAAMSRVDTPEEDRKDFYLYVDEFQNFVTDSFSSILSEARKYRLSLIVAHQYISQITQSSEGGGGKREDNSLKDAVFGNVGSMMCFKIGAADAEAMEKEFAPVFSTTDLVNIANYQTYIKLNIDNATSRGFSMQMIYDPTGRDDEAAEAYRQLSRLKNGRDKKFIDRELAKRIG